jgi:hypothetical protein
MNFRDTGLPDHALVEDAFNYCQSYGKLIFKEAHRVYAQEIDMMYRQQLKVLEMGREQGMTDDEFDAEKENLNKIRDAQLRQGPPEIERQLDAMFNNQRILPVKIMTGKGEKATPEAIAALMLSACLRSPVDFQRIEQRFGKDVGQLVAEVQHIEAYPEERQAYLPTVSEDARRIYMALTVSGILGTLVQVEAQMKQQPARIPMFPPGFEDQVFRDVSVAWGADKKLDAFFVDTFNRACALVSSECRVEVGEDGALELVRGVRPVPRLPGPKPPKPPVDGGGLGGDVF